MGFHQVGVALMYFDLFPVGAIPNSVPLPQLTQDFAPLLSEVFVPHSIVSPSGEKKTLLVDFLLREAKSPHDLVLQGAILVSDPPLPVPMLIHAPLLSGAALSPLVV